MQNGNMNTKVRPNMVSVGRFLNPPSGSFFLFGPRGTGKSTWIQEQFPDALFLDLLEPDVFQDYHIHPEKLKDLVSGNPKRNTIVLDEVQKIPSLLDEVHALIEKKGGRRFVLTGSSPRKLKRTGVNLLAGRAVLCAMHPFMAGELGDRFSMGKALRQGLLPLVEFSMDPVKTLKAYVALYVREEVYQEGMVRRCADFARFLEAISFSHGQELNVSNVSRDCGVDRKTVDNFTSILEDLLLAFRLPIFTRRAKRGLAHHPKFYLFDAGVFRILRPAGPADQPDEIDGAALEGLVAQHLRAWNDYGGDDHKLFFWRTRSGVEVDFVVYGPNTFWAIEVKNSGRLRPEDFRGLKTFKEDYPESKALLLYRGKERLFQNNVLCIPVDDFLKNLRPGKPLSI